MFSRFAIAGVIALAGCGKRTDPAPAVSVTNAASAADSPAADPGEDARIATVLRELTQAVRRYGVEQRRAPRNFEELVSNGYLTSLPQPPPGKTFVINKNLEVNLANR